MKGKALKELYDMCVKYDATDEIKSVLHDYYCLSEDERIVNYVCKYKLANGNTLDVINRSLENNRRKVMEKIKKLLKKANYTIDNNEVNKDIDNREAKKEKLRSEFGDVIDLLMSQDFDGLHIGYNNLLGILKEFHYDTSGLMITNEEVELLNEILDEERENHRRR